MIVVTAPTGLVGHQVLDLLLAREQRVRVVTRDPGRLPDETRARVEVVVGSHGDPDVVAEAFTGADAVFWLVPPDPRSESVEAAYVQFSRPAAQALPGSGVSRVVAISALGRGTAPAARAGYVTATLAVDDMLAETGIAFRAVTNPSFMDNTLRQAQLIKERGVFTSPISGDLRVPSCATRDIAAVASGLLTDRSREGRGEVPVLGPEDLSLADMARTMTEVLGTSVTFQQVAPAAYKERMVGSGMSDAMAQGMLDMAMAKNAGLDSGVERTSVNTTPTSFRTWCQDVLVGAVRGI